MIEREAGAHRKARAAWLVVWSIIYAAVLFGAAFRSLASGLPGDIPLAAASCALLASFTHVSVIARRERGVTDPRRLFISSCLVMLAGLSRNGEGWPADFGVGMIALLFCYSLAFLPAALSWLGRRLGGVHFRASGAPVPGSGFRPAANPRCRRMPERRRVCRSDDSHGGRCSGDDRRSVGGIPLAPLHSGRSSVSACGGVRFPGSLGVPRWQCRKRPSRRLLRPACCRRLLELVKLPDGQRQPVLDCPHRLSGGSRGSMRNWFAQVRRKPIGPLELSWQPSIISVSACQAAGTFLAASETRPPTPYPRANLS